MEDTKEAVVRRMSDLWLKGGRPSARALSRRFLVRDGTDVSNTTISNYLAGQCPEPENMNVDLIVSWAIEFRTTVDAISPTIDRRRAEQIKTMRARARWLSSYAAGDSNPEPSESVHTSQQAA